MFKLLLITTLLLSQNAISCVVLLYHHFDYTTPASTSISPKLFEKHLDYLKTNNFKVLSAGELIKKIKNQQKLPTKCAVLTADDAYISIYKNAYPLLKKYNFTMSVFVATQGVGTYKALMNYQQMRDIKGNIDFYNHSLEHRHLPKSSIKQILKSVNTNQKILIKELGITEKIFAYPYGEFDLKTYKLLKSLDYSAFGQHSGAINLNSDLLRLPRFPMTNLYGKMPSFKTKINTLAFELVAINPISQVVKNNPPTLKITFKKHHNINCFVAGQKNPNITWKDKTAFITAKSPLKIGRTKYNCTASSGEKNRFYWLSKQWIID